MSRSQTASNYQSSIEKCTKLSKEHLDRARIYFNLMEQEPIYTEKRLLLRLASINLKRHRLFERKLYEIMCKSMGEV